MQLIPIEQLKQLASKNVRESNISDFSYDEFKEYCADLVKKMTPTDEYSDSDTTDMYPQTVKWLRDHGKDIKMVGSGSSRTAFALEGGLCLKVAKSRRGTEQNKTEFRNVSAGRDMAYSCFAQVYDASDDYTSILTECCSRYDDEYASRLYGCPSFSRVMFGVILNNLLFNCKFNLDSSIDLCKKKIGFGYDPKLFIPAMELMEKIKSNTEDPKYHVLSDLIRFYREHGGKDDQMLAGDLIGFDNWGMAIRDGEIVPVVLDAGFSRDVMDKYYRF